MKTVFLGERIKKSAVKRFEIILFCVLAVIGFSACGKKDKDIIRNAEQLNDARYTISVDAGSAGAVVAQEKFPNAKFSYNASTNDAYLSVQQGKTDAFVYGKLYLQYAIASNVLDNLAILGDTLDTSDIAVGINPKREDILPQINAFIKQIKADGTLDDMYTRWIVNADKTMPEIPKPENPQMVIKAGTSGLIEPMNYFDENNRLNGFDIEFMSRLAYFMNADIQIETMGFDAMVSSLESGRIDIVVSDLNVTEDRKQVILMSEPYMVSEIAVLVQKSRTENSGTLNSIEQINGQKIALLSGASYDGDVMRYFPDSKIEEYPTYIDCIEAVKSGKATAYITEEPIVSYQLETGGLKYFENAIVQEKYVYMLNKNNYELKKQINDILAKFEKDGTLDALRKEWIEKGGEKSVEKNLPAENSKGVLKVVTSCDVEPFSYIKEDGEPAGFEVDLLAKIAAELGYSLQIEITDFSSFIPAVRDGKADIAFGCMSATEERAQIVGFSDTIYESKVVAVVADSTLDKNFISRLKSSFIRTFVTENRWKLLRDGMFVTVYMSVFAIVLGSLIGFVFGFALESKNSAVRIAANAVSTFLSGMPLVVILMFFYYVLFKDIDISAVMVGIFGLSIDFANTVAGLMCTGVSGVDQGQIEAAASMGYNSRQIFCKITFPQAAKQMFGQYENAIVNLIKGTSIVGYITVEDLTKAGDIIRSRTYEAFFPLIVTSVLYYIIAYIFIRLLSKTEIKLDTKRRSRKVKGVNVDDNN